MGIDHSNPYIHSTTVLCDTHTLTFYDGYTVNIQYILLEMIVEMVKMMFPIARLKLHDQLMLMMVV